MNTYHYSFVQNKTELEIVVLEIDENDIETTIYRETSSKKSKDDLRKSAISNLISSYPSIESMTDSSLIITNSNDIITINEETTTNDIITINEETTTTTTTSTTTTTTTIALTNPDDTDVAQDVSKGNVTQNDNVKNKKNVLTTPGIKTIFETTIKPKQIEIQTPDNNSYSSEIMSGMGFMPVVWYNGTQIDIEHINMLSIYYDGILPCLKLSFVDSVGIMKDKGFPLDDSKITIFIYSRSEQLKSVYTQFKIRNFSNTDGAMFIDSIIDVDGLYIKAFKSYPSSTSNKALQDVCHELGLGFNTNIIETNDSMTWINFGKKAHEFMMEIIERAYISDESFIYGNIDLYYNFNFIDIQKELSRDINNEIGISNQGGLEDILKVKDKTDLSDLFLTNDESVDGQNMYFNNYRIVNNSTEVSTEIGYTDVLKYYDISKKELLNFKINSLNNNTDKSIVMKGAPQDENFFKRNVNYVYGGKMDSDNMHINYNYSQPHNDRNIFESQKISLQIDIPTPNYNLYRFQKIKVILSSKSSTPSSNLINQRLSGDWIIIDVEFRLISKKLLQKVSLVRRELDLASDELASELISSKKIDTGVRRSYDNPIDNTQTTQNISQPSNPPSVKISKYLSEILERKFQLLVNSGIPNNTAAFITSLAAKESDFNPKSKGVAYDGEGGIKASGEIGFFQLDPPDKQSLAIRNNKDIIPGVYSSDWVTASKAFVKWLEKSFPKIISYLENNKEVTSALVEANRHFGSMGVLNVNSRNYSVYIKNRTRGGKEWVEKDYFLHTKFV